MAARLVVRVVAICWDVSPPAMAEVLKLALAPSSLNAAAAIANDAASGVFPRLFHLGRRHLSLCILWLSFRTELGNSGAPEGLSPAGAGISKLVFARPQLRDFRSDAWHFFKGLVLSKNFQLCLISLRA